MLLMGIESLGQNYLSLPIQALGQRITFSQGATKLLQLKMKPFDLSSICQIFPKPLVSQVLHGPETRRMRPSKSAKNILAEDVSLASRAIYPEQFKLVEIIDFQVLFLDLWRSRINQALFICWPFQEVYLYYLLYIREGSGEA